MPLFSLEELTNAAALVRSVVAPTPAYACRRSELDWMTG